MDEFLDLKYEHLFSCLLFTTEENINLQRWDDFILRDYIETLVITI